MEISETRQVGDLEEASVIDAHNSTRFQQTPTPIAEDADTFGVGVINRTAKVGTYWCSLGFAYGRANGGCSLDAYLRPDACCSSPAFRPKKELVGDECDWPSNWGTNS